MSVVLGDPGLKAIRIAVVTADNLAKPDDSSLPDPFAVILVDSEHPHTTSVIKQTLQPYWNEHFDVMVKRSSVVKVQIFDQRKFKRRDRGLLGFVEMRITDYLDLELGGQELVVLDLKGTDDNLAVQGKLICRLAANVTTPTTGYRLTDSSLALSSPPSDNYRRSVNSESIYNESIYNESIDNESIYNDNRSVYNASVYTGSAKSSSVELYSPTINTQNSHTISPEATPIMTISTTLAPFELQQSYIPSPVIPGGTSTADYPENPQRPSAPAPPGQPITNGQHNLNVNEDQYGLLPEGWESGVDLLGLTYYVNRHAHSITRTRPSPIQAIDHQAETTTGHTAIKFRLKGATHSGISMNEVFEGVRLSQRTVYPLHDISMDRSGEMTLKVRWSGYRSNNTYSLPLSTDYHGNVDVQSLARRTARIISHFMETNGISLSYSRLVIHGLEEINLGVYEPVLTTH